MLRVALLMLCACGRVGFDVSTDGGGGGDDQPGTGDGGGSGADGSGSGSGTGGATACTTSGTRVAPATTFPGGNACFDWGGGNSVTNAGIQESAGTLTITPNANSMGAQAYCSHLGFPVTGNGIFVEVSQVLAGANARTRLELDWGGDTYFIGTTGTSLQAGAEDAGLTFSVSYNATMHRWWRIRPDGGDMNWEFSPNGQAWTSIGTAAGVPTGDSDGALIIAGTPTAVAAPGSAKFESINVCP